jgi:hypothetical protein
VIITELGNARSYPWVPGVVAIELPYRRFLYMVPVDRRPIAYAGYTLVRDR